jgi:PAS domain S-box-containing protein
MQRLRRRLEEAEDTLAAIREGHIEALVVHAPEGEQIYTLRTADQPYRLMVEQMREGALTLAEDGTILYCNQRFADLVGRPPERITGGSLFECVVDDDDQTVRDMLKAESSRQEMHVRTSSGGITPVQLSSTALRIDGVRTIAAVVTDLTHERAERGLRETNRLKDEFLATLSHELRTPLNVILGWTRMLLQNPLAEDARHRALELIDRNAHAQAQLVNDLIDMSRITTGKLQIQLEALPLLPLLEAGLASVRPAAETKRLRIDTSWRVDDINVLADPTRLQQILWNLLSNAVKFTPEGGTISMSASRANEHVRIDVADSGIGIDKSFLPHVFDRFRQAESGMRRNFGGLGLGLAIVRDLVSLHGGEVDVRSEGVGFGSTFSVTLRVTDVAPRAVNRRGRLREAASLGGHCILVLEDHADSRELLVNALERSGAAVASFENAREAFEALSRLRPSAIVADIGLPDEDGYSFIRRVRAHRQKGLRTVPAVALSAYTAEPDRAEAIAAGYQQHLAKPVDPGRVVDAIHAMIRSKPKTAHLSRDTE